MHSVQFDGKANDKPEACNTSMLTEFRGSEMAAIDLIKNRLWRQSDAQESSGGFRADTTKLASPKQDAVRCGEDLFES
jgi:hypothetical protein